MAVVMGRGQDVVRRPLWVWAPLGGGHKAEGSLGLWGSESERKWMLPMAQGHRVLVDMESMCLLVPLLSLSLL